MTTVKFVSSLLLGLALWGQSPVPGSFRSSLELAPTTATNVTDPHNVVVVRADATNLTIGSGASATAPQTIRAAGPFIGEVYPRQLTGSVTLTSASGGGTGNVFIYGLPDTGGATTITSMQIVVISNLGGTLNCSGAVTCTVVRNGTPLANQAKRQGVYIAAAAMTAGSPATFNVGGIATQAQGLNAWVKAITVSNVSASPATFTITDGKSMGYLVTGSIPAYTTYEVPLGAPAIPQDNGVVFMERGVRVTAGTASAINVMVRWIQPRPNYSPDQP